MATERPKPPAVKVKMTDLARILGTHGHSLTRHEVQATSVPEHKPYIKLEGESDEQAKVRHAKEGACISGLIWQHKSLKEVLESGEFSIEDWQRAVDRLDFALRLEHSAAIRAVVGASVATGVVADVMLDPSLDAETRLKAALGLAKSYAKHDIFRSKVTETLTRERSGHESQEEAREIDAQVLDEVISALRDVSAETAQYEKAQIPDHTPRPKPTGVLEAEQRRLEELRPPVDTSKIEGGEWTDEDGNPLEEDDE